MPEIFHHYLIEDYELCEYDVFCGRGSQSLNHIGNKHFTSIIHSLLNRYSNAFNKQQKIDIITEVINKVRSVCNLKGGSGFIKQDLENWRYYEIGDALAREKVSQAFRDAMREKSRKQKRKEISQAIDKNSLSKECSSNRKMQQSSLHRYGSPTLSSRIPKILKEDGDVSHGQHRNVASKTQVNDYNDDVSHYSSSQKEQKRKYVEESTIIKNSRCSSSKDRIYNTPNSKTQINQSIDNNDDDGIDEEEEDKQLYNFLILYSEMFQWTEDDNNNWYEPIPLK